MLDPADQLLVFCLGRPACHPTLSYPTLGFLTIHLFHQCGQVSFLHLLAIAFKNMECLLQDQLFSELVHQSIPVYTPLSSPGPENLNHYPKKAN